MKLNRTQMAALLLQGIARNGANYSPIEALLSTSAPGYEEDPVGLKKALGSLIGQGYVTRSGQKVALDIRSEPLRYKYRAFVRLTPQVFSEGFLHTVPQWTPIPDLNLSKLPKRLVLVLPAVVVTELGMFVGGLAGEEHGDVFGGFIYARKFDDFSHYTAHAGFCGIKVNLFPTPTPQVVT